jgi:hypothetical protein
MDYAELETLNKEFAEQTKQMIEEFAELYQKWMKKDARTTLVHLGSLPINMLMTLMTNGDNHVSKVFPELPDMYERYFMPFQVLKDKWGVIPDSKFVEEYGKVYQSQFTAFFPDEQEKKNFERWYKAQNPGRKK